MGAKKLGKLIFITDAHRRGNRFNRQIGGQKQGSRAIEANVPQFLHGRAAGQPLESADEGEAAHFPETREIVESDGTRQIFVGIGEDGLEPWIGGSTANAPQFPKQTFEERSPRFGLPPRPLILDDPGDELPDTVSAIVKVQRKPGQ